MASIGVSTMGVARALVSEGMARGSVPDLRIGLVLLALERWGSDVASYQEWDKKSPLTVALNRFMYNHHTYSDM